MNAICQEPGCKTTAYGIPERLEKDGWLINRQEGLIVKCPEHSGKVVVVPVQFVTSKAAKTWKDPGLISSYMED